MSVYEAAKAVVDDGLGWWTEQDGTERVSYPVDRDGCSDPEADAVFVALRRAVEEADSLDAAWAEAEAALPEGAQFWAGRAAERQGHYFAAATWGGWIDSRERERSDRTVAPTLAAALRALAERLREARG